jgi:uncharacterized protein YukE
MSTFGLNLSTVLDLVQLAVAFETGGASLALQQAGQMALKDVSSQAFSASLSRLNITGDQSSARNAFNDAFSLASGLNGGSNSLTQKLLDASYRHGGLADSMNQLTDAMTNLTIALGRQGQDDSGGGDGSGDNWLVAIAKAMGNALGRLSAKLVDESRQLDHLAGDTSSGGAQKFQSTMAKFQADAQTLGMLSDAFSNAIKSIGQGMQTMASKQ